MLNDTKCRSAKTVAGKPIRLFDYGGLYLEVAPTGSNHWRLKYRYFGKEKRLSFGAYPGTSLLEARDKRDQAKKLLQQGDDPSAVKREERKLARYKAEQTFRLVADEWIERGNKNWSARYTQTIKSRLALDVYPDFGKDVIAHLPPRRVLACIQKIEDRGAHDIARRVLSYISQIFRYAVLTERAERDITVDIRGTLKRRNKGHYASIGVEELPDFIKALNSPNARLFVQTRLAIRLMLLTFVRTRELIEATWDEFDLDKAEWHIPAHRMKMRVAHFVPLSRQAIEILQVLRNMKGMAPQHDREKEAGKFVFPSVSKPNKAMSNNTILSGLDSLGYNKKMTGHGFRSLAMSTIKERLGYQHEVVDRQLAHLPKSKIDQAYDRAKFLPQRKRMMQEWAEYLETI